MQASFTLMRCVGLRQFQRTGVAASWYRPMYRRIFRARFATGREGAAAAGHIAVSDLGFRTLRVTEWSRRTATNCPPIIEWLRGGWAASTTNTASRQPRDPAASKIIAAQPT